MNYSFLPIESHVDLGFGATADSFRESANLLFNQFNDRKSFMEKMPLCFLLRHSLELYLKSMIMVMHIGLEVPFSGGSQRTDPKIVFDGKERRLFSEHGIKNLFEYFETFVKKYKTHLDKVAGTDWSDIPLELRNMIIKIDAFDQKSAYFRYPITNRSGVDREKSSFKKVDGEDFGLEHIKKPLKVFILEQSNEEHFDTYIYDESALPIIEDLRNVSNLLSGAHLGIRIELADGF